MQFGGHKKIEITRTKADVIEVGGRHFCFSEKHSIAISRAKRQRGHFKWNMVIIQSKLAADEVSGLPSLSFSNASRLIENENLKKYFRVV